MGHLLLKGSCSLRLSRKFSDNSREFRDATRTGLELGDFRDRIERANREKVRGFIIGPMVRNKDRIFSDSVHYGCLKCHLTTPALNGDEIACFDAGALGEKRVHFYQGLRVLIDQAADTPRLRSTEILADDATC